MKHFSPQGRYGAGIQGDFYPWRHLDDIMDREEKGAFAALRQLQVASCLTREEAL